MRADSRVVLKGGSKVARRAAQKAAMTGDCLGVRKAGHSVVDWVAMMASPSAAQMVVLMVGQKDEMKAALRAAAMVEPWACC